MKNKNLLMLGYLLVATMGIVSCANQDILQPDRSDQEKMTTAEFQ